MGIAAYFASLSIVSLVGRLPGGVAQGIIWGIMALGVFITFRVLNTSDLSVDGTFSTGGAVAVMMLLGGAPAWLAVLVATLAGIVAGLVTGILHTRLGIPAILAGILTQFALYSINLHIMDGSANKAINADKYSLLLSGRSVTGAIIVGGIFAVLICEALYWYFGTEQGSALRATGNNPAMSRAQGINIDTMKVIGFGLANGLVALAGALMAQYQGYADINMGRGAIVIGLASIIIGETVGEALLKKHFNFNARLLSIVLGGIIYYIVVILVLWMKLPTNDLKLFTAVVVAIFLAVPYIRSASKTSFRAAAKKGEKL